MRLKDPRAIHTLALYLLPVLVAATHWGVWATLLMALAAGLVGMAVRLAAMRRAAVAPEPRLRLHTITFSHYSEKVRWCLDRLGVPYDEVPNVGILGVLLTGRTVPWLEVPPGLTRVGESPRILRYLWGEYAGRLPSQQTWFLEPTAAALDLEGRFDRRLGNDVRVWAYGNVLKRRDLTLRTWGIEERTIPAWQRGLLAAGMPVLRIAVRRMLGVTPQRAERALEKTRAAFDEVDRMLVDGRRYLVGDALTFADITFASLGALAVLPPEYPGGRTGRGLEIADLDPEWRAEVERFRQRPSGQFILRLYREERASGAASLSPDTPA
jgi:glutathione S-transferase